METEEWVLLAVVIVVALAVAVWIISRQRREALRRRFGGEYDRTVERAENRRQAELDLRERARERDRLEIRPLTPLARERHGREWQAIQARFVDQPVQAVADADSLLATVMAERGYPHDFEQHVDVISVDHPTVVENYRMAHATRDRALGEGRTSTEELRETLLHYRSLFDELLGSDDDELVTGEAEAQERGRAR